MCRSPAKLPRHPVKLKNGSGTGIGTLMPTIPAPICDGSEGEKGGEGIISQCKEASGCRSSPPPSRSAAHRTSPSAPGHTPLRAAHLVLELARRPPRVCEDGGAVAVLVGVDEGDGGVQVGRVQAHQHRPKDLLAVARHGGVHARQQGGAQEVAARVLGHLDTPAIQQQLGALINAWGGG